MFEKLEITRMAQALASHAGARMGVIARNIANADTPGFKAQDMPDFAKAYAAQSQGEDMRVTRARHFGAGEIVAESIAQDRRGAAAPNGNSVSLEGEMVMAVEARQQHDMALAIYRSSSDIIRISLGRGR